MFRSKNRIVEGYTEKHHIIPKSLGGSNKKENIAILTAKEHFMAHLLLTKCLDGKEKAKMIHAAKRMMVTGNKYQQNRYVPSGRIYEMIKQAESAILSIKTKNNNPMDKPGVKAKHAESMIKRGKSPGMTGQSHSLSTKQKMRDKRALQEPMTEKTRQTLRELYQISYQGPDGTIYSSRSQAAIAHNVTPACVRYWVNTGTKGWRKLEK